MIPLEIAQKVEETAIIPLDINQSAIYDMVRKANESLSNMHTAMTAAQTSSKALMQLAKSWNLPLTQDQADHLYEFSYRGFDANIKTLEKTSKDEARKKGWTEPEGILPMMS